MLIIGCDHSGFELKEAVRKFLIEQNTTFIDIGTKSYLESIDYPVVVEKALQVMNSKKNMLVILVSGIGGGMSMVANKHSNTRAVTCTDTYSAKIAKEQLDSNVLCLSQRVTGEAYACTIVETWLGATFQHAYHTRRLAQIQQIETKGKVIENDVE